jgi:hypothetical protein
MADFTGRDDPRKDIMRAFTIDAENDITVFESMNETEGREAGTQRFTSAQELASLAAGWPGARLVEVWNGLPGVEPIRRFTSRTIAANRIWRAIQNLEPAGSEPVGTAALKGSLRASRPEGRHAPRRGRLLRQLK